MWVITEEEIMEKKKTALITGASSGIGRAFASKCAALGCDLILVARNENKLNTTAKELSGAYQAGSRIISADLTVKEDVERLVKEIADDGSIFMLINNAGFAVPARFAESDIEKQLNMIRVHVTAATRLTRAALPVMLKKRSGYIINVSSTLAFASFPHNAVYCATKAYLNSFTKTLHYEYRGTGVVFQALNPGLTKTNFHNTDAFKNIPENDSEEWIAMTPEAVVDYSFRKLGKRLIVVPGCINRFSVAHEGLFTKILCRKVKA
jgi:short-subunit dehydrogenase